MDLQMLHMGMRSACKQQGDAAKTFRLACPAHLTTLFCMTCSLFGKQTFALAAHTQSLPALGTFHPVAPVDAQPTISAAPH